MTPTSTMTSSQRWALILPSIGAFMIALDALVVATALSTIRTHLGASIEELEWTVNAYTLTLAVLLMTGAALGDRFGRRRVFNIGVGLFVVASAACALSPSIGWLIAARAVQGCGAALIMPLAATLVSEAFPPHQRGRALGLFSATAGFAVLLGPVVGGAISQGLSWQWIFWLNVPIGLIAIPLVRLRLDESYGSHAPMDILGLVLISGATFGVVWGLVRGNGAGWGSPEVVLTLGAGVALGVAYVVWELRTRHPMLPMRFFLSRSFAAGNAAAFTYFASLYGATFFIAQFLQVGQGDSPLGAGVRMLPWTITLFLAAPLSGALINRLGERTLILTAMSLQAVAFAIIALIAKADLPYVALLAPFIVAGVGPSAIPASQHAVFNSVAPGAIGKASGTFNMLRQLGAAFGVAVTAALFSSAGSFHSPQAFTQGFSHAMWTAAALSAVGAVTALALPSSSAFAKRTHVTRSFAAETAEGDVPAPLSA